MSKLFVVMEHHFETDYDDDPGIAIFDDRALADAEKERLNAAAEVKDLEGLFYDVAEVELNAAMVEAVADNESSDDDDEDDGEDHEFDDSDEDEP